MIKRIMGAAALMVLMACGQEPAAIVEATAPISSGIDVHYMDTSVKPGDDFFRYMNGKWLDETEIPADKSNYGGFVILADEAQEKVKAIIEESATGDFAKGTDEQKVGDLYRSYMDIETRNALGITPLLPEFEKINSISSHDELTVYFGRASRYGVSVPLNIEQLVDWNDPTRYSLIVTQGGLGLADREYYVKEDDLSADIRDKYVVHIEKMFDLAGLPDAAAAATTIMALETRLAEKNMTKEAARNRAENYKPIVRADLRGVMPEFDWDAYLAEFGVAETESVVLYMIDYLGELDQIIRTTDLDTWKTYLTWKALDDAAAFLSEDLDNQNFDFYSKTLAGIEVQQPMWRRGTRVVSARLGEVVGKVYVARHFPPEAKRRMEQLVANLINAYEKSIKELDWMSDATKVEALRKLSKFTPKVGYPDEWRDYSALDIEGDDLFGNLERAILAEHEREMDRHNGPVDRGEWGMTPQTVNAYYHPALNEIVFPAAILQPPFFNLDADEAVNYGAIGAIIGHEIGHGFDDQGSTFDGDGKLRDWWTDADRAEFETRTGKLVEQYSAFAPFEDLHVNGEFTLGENIGDLGGITIGLLAYQMSLNGKEAPVIDGFTGAQRVFLGYAQVWRRKYRDEALRQRIATDPHAPSEYRANGAVRNVPEFYEAFNVEEGDALYLAPEDRVKIW
ncbi:MAG: peptidase M13 [Proteobacteria bacterium]|nr:peptidase M13 [Pseudomonadota bacterium]